MSAEPRARTRGGWVAPLIVALATFAAFLPVLQNGFVDWDDQKNFLDNPHYRGLGLPQLGWMWTTFHMGHYVPLSWMTLGLDYLLWGMNARGYHLTNLLFHTANAVLLYFVARRLLRPAPAAPGDAGSLAPALPAAFAALFFAVHPLRVESVAWITERRDVLSLFFCLVSVLAHLRACDTDGRGGRWYWISLATFLCALLSKATAVSLPAVLALLNVHPLRRLGGANGWWSPPSRRVYGELLPFALLSAATVVLSIVALHPPDQLPLAAKVAVSAFSFRFYLWKTLVPAHLSPLYEMPPSVDPLGLTYVVGYAVAAAFAGLAWWLRHRRPGVTAALLGFAVIILPMIGAVQNGPQVTADRYTYFAAPALALLAGAGLRVLLRRGAIVPIVLGAGVLVALGTLTWRQTHVWHDSGALWSRVLGVDSTSSIAHSATARLLLEGDRIDEAIAHARRALALAPDYAEAHNDLGVALARQGNLADAMREYARAVSLKPRDDEALNNWGVALGRQGDPAGAIERFREALAINPDNADAHVNWGNMLVRLEHPDEAIAHYREAVRIRPSHADAHHNWGVALARQGLLVEAIEQFQRALAIKPGHAEARQYLERATTLQRKP